MNELEPEPPEIDEPERLSPYQRLIQDLLHAPEQALDSLSGEDQMENGKFNG